MPCRLGFTCVSVLVTSILATSTTAYGQCRLDVGTSGFGQVGDPLVRRVLSIDAGIALADATTYSGTDAESVKILHWNGASWDVVQQLFPDDQTIETEFGASGAVHGNVAVVGAPNTPCAGGEQCGAVYIYRFDGTTWVSEATLTNPTGNLLNRFGRFLAFDGEVLVIQRTGSYLTYRFVDGAWILDGSPPTPAQIPAAWLTQIQVFKELSFVRLF